MGLFERIVSGLLDALDGPGGRSLAKRTLCCDAEIWDLWSHEEGCAHWRGLMETYKTAHEKWVAAGGKPHMMPHANYLPPYGDRSGKCPHCAYPTGHYGIYTVGEPCGHCGYIEKRRDPVKKRRARR